MLIERTCSCHVSLEVLKDKSPEKPLESPYWRTELIDGVFDLPNKEDVSRQITAKRKGDGCSSTETE